jgi:hypothetical protein
MTKKVIGALLTIISIHRVFPTSVKPSLDTILEPFAGVSTTLNPVVLKKALKELKWYKSYNINNKASLY